MITDASIEIDAPADVVWTVFADVERWPDWTESVQRLVAVDGTDLRRGARFRIKQPRMPDLVWAITEVDPGASWSWVQRSPGGTTVATHEVVALSPEQTLVRQRIDQRGPVGATVGLLTRGMTRRYLDLEAQGLKRTSEARHLGAATS